MPAQTNSHIDSVTMDSVNPSVNAEAGHGAAGTADSGDAHAVHVDDAPVDTADGRGSTPSAVSRLEEEGDIAADYLEELLDIADLDGDIDIEVRNGRTYISIVSDEDDKSLTELVGRDGEVLDALQELTRLSVLAATDNRSRLVLDIAGYRQRRGTELAHAAQDAVDRIKAGEESVALEPMGAYERKIVHDAVAALGFVSESEGDGANRHIVVTAE